MQTKKIVLLSTAFALFIQSIGYTQNWQKSTFPENQEKCSARLNPLFAQKDRALTNDTSTQLESAQAMWRSKEPMHHDPENHNNDYGFSEWAKNRPYLGLESKLYNNDAFQLLESPEFRQWAHDKADLIQDLSNKLHSSDVVRLLESPELRQWAESSGSSQILYRKWYFLVDYTIIKACWRATWETIKLILPFTPVGLLFYVAHRKMKAYRYNTMLKNAREGKAILLPNWLDAILPRDND